MMGNPLPHFRRATRTMTDWHRLFGVALYDLFAGSPWTVELEKDLSIKKQLLDVVIVRRGPGEFAGRLPDGLEHLADHNLLSYKSLREPLDDWALKELTGHYVNYRKQVSGEKPLPEEAFRLFGISTRFPDKLAAELRLDRMSEGIYEARRGSDRIIIIVLKEIPASEHNSLWNLFSGVPETVQCAAAKFREQTGDVSSILNKLFETYALEGLRMPYTIEDFRRDCARDWLPLLTPEERIKGLPPEERIKGLPPEERIKGLPPEEIVKALPPQEIVKGLTPDELLKQLPRNVIEEYLRKTKDAASGNDDGPAQRGGDE
jgi:hypothetical protein